MTCEAMFSNSLLQNMICISAQGTTLKVVRSDFDHFSISTTEAEKPSFTAEHAIFGDESQDLYRKVVKDF